MLHFDPKYAVHPGRCNTINNYLFVSSLYPIAVYATPASYSVLQD